MTDREKMAELIADLAYKTNAILCDGCGNVATSDVAKQLADQLIANGVTFATDNNVAYKMKATDKDTNVPSNGDRIRAMTDEELGKFMCSRLDCYGSDCPGKHLCHPGSNGLVEWMKQPAEVE